MEIRGHHFLCMLGFRGLGYDEEFVKNMNEIIERLNNEQDMLIKVVDNVDNICALCPNNIDGECKIESYPGSVREKDRAVLKILGIKVGEVIRYRDIVNKIKENMTEEKMMNICKDCEWFGLGYCLEGLKKLKGG
ncbi:DUF1284 domain-containing protein [Caldanaerobacter subterraneus]|uniref:DUF1284 domain-containing protein n=1 Tax=Caldanaerobacter subterraneus TaxID=911092 RepID=A0A4R2J627_9THEO|nr:DUF1284 domain-containing protein [Caldanaerobacter subterraneus]TCO54413.1 hypothetical protein EV203_1544 [Caldanaerobacter subterraneus]